MNGHNPRVDPRVRLAIAPWPDDAPRGAVSALCAEQGIWRKTFYERRARARSEGPAAAFEPHSTRPASSPTRIGQEMVLRALAVRSALESSGPGPRPHLGARQDALDGAGGPLARVPGADPCAARGAGPQRAPQAPPLGLAPVRPARPPTPAGSWTPPSTSWPAGARPSSSSSRTTTVAWRSPGWSPRGRPATPRSPCSTRASPPTACRKGS